MDQILIKDLLIRGIIGISDRERENPQDILVNLVLYTNIRKAGQTDNVDDSVNYRTITKKVYAFVEQAARHTVEALATDIARICLGEPHVKGVRVRVEKPGAVRFSRSVGVEIERWQEEESEALHEAVVLIGSNIEPETNVPQAIARLQETSELITVSQIWETEPVGSAGPNFLNIAAMLRCKQDADALKDEILYPIENELGRVRTPDRNAPRTIDLDIVLFDEQVLEQRLWELPFIAIPVAELCPDLQSPLTEQTLQQVAERLRIESSARLYQPDEPTS